MAIHDFKSQRLFVDADLGEDRTFEVSREQANYLLNVLRLKSSSGILIFNGRDGEWQAEIRETGRKKCTLRPVKMVREQPEQYRLTYCFAPLKQARLDYMIQKAVEMGVGILQPVITQFTQVRALNEKRMLSNAIEAAEQCGILNMPEIYEPVALQNLPGALGTSNQLFFCDEEAHKETILSKEKIETSKGLALLIGPEGGFSDEERAMIKSWSNVRLLGLGPRILRADTAAVAALSIIQANLGDWYTN